jgi:hypothetical protein
MEKKVADLRSHEDCQARLGLTEEAVKSYEQAYKAGKALPALEVFEVNGELIVVDGFHRLEAARRAGVETLPVEIVGKGTMAEAEWAALGKNHNHGVRRTREDKRKAVQMALANTAAAKLTNRSLAKYLEVSHTFVANERKMAEVLGEVGNVASPEVEWARTMLAGNAAYWIEDCKKNVRLNQAPGAHNIDGPMTVGSGAQTAGTFTTANFDVRVEVTEQPYTNNFDDCGIVVIYSGGYMCCGIYRNDSVEPFDTFAYCQSTGDTFTEVGSLGVSSGLAPFELRIQRDTGNVYRAYYDIGGGFVQIGTDSTLTPDGITPTGVAMYVGGPTTLDDVTEVKFDWFFEESSAFYAYEDTGETGPGPGARRVMVVS